MHATQGCAPLAALMVLHPGLDCYRPLRDDSRRPNRRHAHARVLNLKSPAACVPLGTAVSNPGLRCALLASRCCTLGWIVIVPYGTTRAGQSATHARSGVEPQVPRHLRAVRHSCKAAQGGVTRQRHATLGHVSPPKLSSPNVGGARERVRFDG